jgi:hypothetical protein
MAVVCEHSPLEDIASERSAEDPQHRSEAGANERKREQTEERRSAHIGSDRVYEEETPGFNTLCRRDGDGGAVGMAGEHGAEYPQALECRNHPPDLRFQVVTGVGGDVGVASPQQIHQEEPVPVRQPTCNRSPCCAVRAQTVEADDHRLAFRAAMPLHRQATVRRLDSF